MTINQMVISPFDILRQAQDDIVMVSLSNHQGDNSGLLQKPLKIKNFQKSISRMPPSNNFFLTRAYVLNIIKKIIVEFI